MESLLKIFHLIKTFLTKSPNLTSLSIASVISNVIGGLFWFYIASLLGTELYGQVSYLLSIAIIGSVISLTGSANTLIVLSAKKLNIQSTVFFITIICASIISLVLYFIFTENISVSIFVIGYVLFVLTTSDLLGNKLFVKYSKFVILQKITQICLSLILYHILGINGLILGIGFSFIPFGILAVKHFKISKIDFSLLKNRSKFIANNYFLDISKSLEGSIDKIILAPILGFALLGNFQLGVQVLSVLTILPVVVSQYTLPNDASGNSVIRIKKFVILISIVLAILSFFAAPALLPIVFPQYIESIFVIQIMSLVLIPFTITTTYTSKFLGNENSKIVLVGTCIFIAIQIPSLFILSTYFGISGAATSILISRVGETIYYVISNKFLKL